MLKLAWSRKAQEDLRQISAYVAERNPVAARRLRDAIAYTAEQLPEHPFLYRQGRVPGTREAVVHPNYVLIYRVEDAAIRIIAVIHARQRYP